MKNYLPLLLALIFLAPIAFAEPEGAGAKEAKAATVEHNTEIDTAEKRLEAVIVRAEQDYARQAIRSKMAYNKELQKAKRTALQGDSLDNAAAIVKQIELVEKQIEHLKNVLAGRTRLNPVDKPKEEVKKEPKIMKGLDPRLIGEWDQNRPHATLLFKVSPDGKMTIIRNQHIPSENGRTYQMKIIKGIAVVTYDGWVDRITDTFEVTNKGLIVRSWDHKGDFYNGRRENHRWGASWDNKVKEEPKEEPKEEVKEEKSDDNFFGIPLK